MPVPRMRWPTILAAAALSLAGLGGGARPGERATPGAAALGPASAAAQASEVASSPAPEPGRDYLVRLADPPLAGYRGGFPGLAATAVDAAPPAPEAAGGAGRDVHLATTGPAAEAYLARLRREQDRVLAAIRRFAPGLEPGWRYRYVFNGFSARLRPEDALRVMRLPGVASVHAAETLAPELDSSLPLIGAPGAWQGVGGAEEAGLGARIAIVDTGMDALHPFFHDADMPPAPPGFPAATLHLRDGRVLGYPEPARFVNGKVIAARSFIPPEMAEGQTEADLLARFTPFSGGHGLHVGGIAAGRLTPFDLPTFWGQTQRVTLAGVAPMAWLLNYKYDFSTGAEYGRGENLAGTPELIAMLEQMVLDRVDVLNLSEGHVTFLIDHPTTHPLALAFEEAAAAGIVVVVSAGNAGANGPTSLSGAFKYSERILAVASSSSNGSIDLPVDLWGEGRPAERLFAGPRGDIPITEAISATLALAPDGGCAPAPEAAGRIVVVERFDAAGAPIGACSYAARAELQAAAGALAILYVYYDRANAGSSATALALPAAGFGATDGAALADWLREGPSDAAATIQGPVLRSYQGEADVLAGSSSRGPGFDGGLKPDIAAPGVDIYSARSAATGGNPSFVASSGTSMAAPHVAGAAALLRAAHRDWDAARIRGTLINTSRRGLQVLDAAGARPARFSEGGPGRLELGQALEPGAALDPPKAAFGRIGRDEAATREIAISNDLDREAVWAVSVEPLGGDALPSVEPARLTLPPEGRGSLELRLDPRAALEREHWGDVVLSLEGDGRTLRLPYYAQVAPAERRDLLLVNWTEGGSRDFGRVYSETLRALGLTVDLWDFRGPGAAHPPLQVLQDYALVVVNTNESRVGLQQAYSGQYQYFNHLIGGGNLLLTGQGAQSWWTVGTRPEAQQGAQQNQGCDMCLSRYFAGFQFGITATLSGRLLSYPERPATPTLEVLLPPHPGGAAPFDYALDISTGSLAKGDAAGNQYSFASGGLLGDYDPAREHPYTEGVFERVRPWARPLWSYEGRGVGSFVAGRQHPEAKIAWNAMYWGFGLEGVGSAGPGTADRARLLGDSFNFLAHNLWIERLRVEAGPGRLRRLLPQLPPAADLPLIRRVTVDWGDGTAPEVQDLDPPRPADQLVVEHRYAADGTYRVALSALPQAHAAPLHAALELRVGDAAPLYLPWTADSATFGDPLPPSVTPARSAAFQ